MGKYSKYEKKEVVAPYKIHPIWRAFGCVMIILIPIMSGAAAWELVNGLGKNLPYISGMRGNLQLPQTLYTLPYISLAAAKISSIPNLPALIIFFLLILILFTGIVSMLYAMIYRVIGPPRYTQIDAPAPRVTSVRKHKR
jgi:hypothetical protein